MMLCLLGLVFDVLSLLGLFGVGCVLVEFVCFVVWCCFVFSSLLLFDITRDVGVVGYGCVLVFGLVFCYCLALYWWLWICIRWWGCLCFRVLFGFAVVDFVMLITLWGGLVVRWVGDLVVCWYLAFV